MVATKQVRILKFRGSMIWLLWSANPRSLHSALTRTVQSPARGPCEATITIQGIRRNTPTKSREKEPSRSVDKELEILLENTVSAAKTMPRPVT